MINLLYLDTVDKLKQKDQTMNATKLFNESLPAVLATRGEEAKTVGAKFQFNVLGAGEWNLDLTQSGPRCVAGTGPADVVITISDENFTKLAKNPEGNAMSMLFTGKLKVTGNQMLAMKLKTVFAYVQE